jgi:two-component system KDP operon response regulator KdpE
MKQIVLIYQETTARERIASALQKSGFQVIEAEDIPMGMRKLYELHPDLVIIAEKLDEEVIADIRKGCNVPIIVLGEAEGIARVAILEAGADSYLNELVARVHSLLRRYHKPGRNPQLDPEGGRVKLNGNYIDLTPTEFCLFSYLVFNEGKVVPYSQIINELWDGGVSVDNLHFHLRHLKQKLGIDSVGSYRLLNYRGEGYCFCVSDVPSAEAMAIGSTNFWSREPQQLETLDSPRKEMMSIEEGEVSEPISVVSGEGMLNPDSGLLNSKLSATMPRPDSGFRPIGGSMRTIRQKTSHQTTADRIKLKAVN